MTTSLAPAQLLLLAVMALQNSAVVLVARHTLTAAPAAAKFSSTSIPAAASAAEEEEEADFYDVNHMFLITETCKFVLSSFCECIAMARNSHRGTLSFHAVSIFGRKLLEDGAWNMAIPAVLYLVQNNLSYFAIANLSVPVFHVTYQAKLVTTAMLSVLMLKRKYSRRQWIRLVSLSAGVATVVGEGLMNDREYVMSRASTEKITGTAINIVTSLENESFLFGIFSVGMSCTIGALASIYFEMVLKKKPPPTLFAAASKDRGSTGPNRSRAVPVSVWVRNSQLAFFSVLTILVQHLWSAIVLSSKTIDTQKPKTYFHGFDWWIWLLIVLRAVQSIFIAAVIKYTDNVLKGIATGLSVCFTSAISSQLFGTSLGGHFLSGAALVLFSAYFFSNPIPKALLKQSLWIAMAISVIWVVYKTIAFHFEKITVILKNVYAAHPRSQPASGITTLNGIKIAVAISKPVTNTTTSP